MGWPDTRFLCKLVKKHLYGAEIEKVEFIPEEEIIFRFLFSKERKLEVVFENNLGVFLDSEKGEKSGKKL
jgi:predicted ribosome quality control (RQC) complex YloA/Tae2 family protein